jgi:hypothetical protein
VRWRYGLQAGNRPLARGGPRHLCLRCGGAAASRRGRQCRSPRRTTRTQRARRSGRARCGAAAARRRATGWRSAAARGSAAPDEAGRRDQPQAWHAGSCRIMQDHAGSCRIMQDHAGSCRIMQDHAGSAPGVACRRWLRPRPSSPAPPRAPASLAWPDTAAASALATAPCASTPPQRRSSPHACRQLSGSAAGTAHERCS